MGGKKEVLPFKDKVFCFYLLSPFRPRLVSQGEEVKKNSCLVKQQVGFEPGTFGSTVKCFNHLATCHFNPCRPTGLVVFSRTYQ